MTEVRTEADSLGRVEVPADKLGGADPALIAALQHWPGSDPARDDHGLRDPEACRSRREPCRRSPQ